MKTDVGSTNRIKLLSGIIYDLTLKVPVTTSDALGHFEIG